jgi:hypothetical protein
MKPVTALPTRGQSKRTAKLSARHACGSYRADPGNRLGDTPASAGRSIRPPAADPGRRDLPHGGHDVRCESRVRGAYSLM